VQERLLKAASAQEAIALFAEPPLAQAIPLRHAA